MKVYLLATALLALACKRAEPVVLPGDTESVAAADSSVNANGGNTSSAATQMSRSCGVTGDPLLTDGGIGELRVGRTVADMKQLCDVVTDADRQSSEGTMDRVLTVRIAGEIVPVTIVNDKVWRVAVTTPRIRTADSLGVDTPLQRIAAMRGARFFPGEDGVYAFVSDHCALSFRFSLPLRPPKGGQWTATAIAQAHGDVAVDRVLVTECRK